MSKPIHCPRFVPTSAGCFLLNGQPVRVHWAWSRYSLMVVDGEQAGQSVALVRGVWSALEPETTVKFHRALCYRCQGFLPCALGAWLIRTGAAQHNAGTRAAHEDPAAPLGWSEVPKKKPRIPQKTKKSNGKPSR